MSDLVVGVDVGTGSARAGVFDLAGKRLGSATRNIRTWTYNGGDFVEQSSEDIWRSCAEAVKEALGGIDKQRVVGISFDATCSLVVLNGQGQPLSVSDEDDPSNERNIIVWMDHRSEQEARAVNEKGHSALGTVGGVISPEMEIPKIMWLASHKPECTRGKLFDLADYLTWRASGVNVRSLCTLVCKWNLDADSNGARWNDDFLESVGLKNLRAQCDIGGEFKAPGSELGTLTSNAASDLGLSTSVKVGVGIIDAHAGGIGCVGASQHPMEGRLALIAGTSACHMCSTEQPCFAPGVWGPYWGAMVPGYYLNEGGISAAGQLLDFLVQNHAAYSCIPADQNDYAYLNNHLATMGPSVALLARHVHVDPDFRGNRAPLADPTRLGSVMGLSCDNSMDALAVLYLAAVQAIAYQTRHIVDQLVDSGRAPITEVLITGGLAKNPVFVQTVADAMHVPVVLPEEEEAVMLGAAVLGATGAGKYKDVETAMAAMTRPGSTIKPDASLAAFHDAKYACYRKLSAAQSELRGLMGAV
jgi:FGGY-family pentulose kinase